jgi:hypothetical protein
MPIIADTALLGTLHQSFHGYHPYWYLRTIAGPVRIALATVMAHSKHLTTEEPLPWLDQSGLAALLAGSLVVLITFFTSYSHVDIPTHFSIEVNQQIGISLLLAALATLVGVDEVFSEGVVSLASNNRCADQRDRIAAGNRAAEERNRYTEDRECTARRARIQARLAAAQRRFLLADSPRNRLQLSETLALLLEDLASSTGLPLLLRQS